jgi:hypothetical protein
VDRAFGAHRFLAEFLLFCKNCDKKWMKSQKMRKMNWSQIVILNKSGTKTI